MKSLLQKKVQRKPTKGLQLQRSHQQDSKPEVCKCLGPPEEEKKGGHLPVWPGAG